MQSIPSLNTNSTYAEWYKTYKAGFLTIGHQFGYAPEETLDFVHQFFLDLIEKKIDPDTIENPGAYLSVVFKRRLIDKYRQNHRGSNNQVVLDQDSLSESSIQEKIEYIESDRQLVSSIRRAFDTLPERCKVVIDMKFYQGLNTEQIADQLGLSRRSVYNNLYEGVKLLRKRLSEDKAAIGLPVSAIISFLIVSL